MMQETKGLIRVDLYECHEGYIDAVIDRPISARLIYENIVSNKKAYVSA